MRHRRRALADAGIRDEPRGVGDDHDRTSVFVTELLTDGGLTVVPEKGMVADPDWVLPGLEPLIDARFSHVLAHVGLVVLLRLRC